MQAVIALCHFCENHGPRVVMTCQPMRDFEYSESSHFPSSSLLASTSASHGGPIIPVVHIEDNFELFNSNRSCSSGSIPFHYGNCSKATLDSEDRCKACSSFGGGPCLLSNDHPTKTSYISSEVALQDRVYDRVRSACVRSLSCEVTSSSRRHVAPGSPPSASTRSLTRRRRENSNSISETGSNMSALRFMPPKSSAINISNKNNSPKIVVNKGEYETKEIDNIIFRDEVDGCLIFGDSDTGFVFSMTFRLHDAKARGFLRLFSIIIVSNDLTLLTNNYPLFKCATMAISAELQEFATKTYEKEIGLGEKHGEDEVMRPEYASIVGRMPRWFRRKIAIDTDRNLETITEKKDIWIRLHRRMMWTLRSPTLTCRDQVMEGKPTQDMMVLMEMDESTIVELELHHPNQHAVSMNQLSNLKWIAAQLELCGEPGDLDLLIRHVVTGGQILVESKERSVCRQFLLALSNLLPIGCLRLATYKEHYIPEYSTRFNLIGGPINIDVPLEVSDVMILRITSKDITQFGDENVSLCDCNIQVRRRPEKDEVHRQPQIVKRYKELLLDPDVNDTVLETTLRTTREFWMSKAKICYQMRTQLKTQQQRFADVFHVIKGICSDDQQVILFWQAGLSNAYKNHVLATIESPMLHDVLQH